MPLITASVVPKNVNALPALAPVAIVAGGVPPPGGSGQNIGVDVLTDISKNSDTSEYAARYIQNVGANSCNYAIGQDCTAGVYHGQIAAGQQFNASDFGQRVNVFSATGTNVTVTILRRRDMASGSGGIIPAKQP